MARAKGFNWTPKREQFCHEYTVDFDGKAAAGRAGFSKRTAKQIAHELLQIPEIQQKVAELSKLRQEEADVDAVYVLKGAKELFERCMQHRPVFDNEGRPVLVETPRGDIAPAYEFDAAGAGRALKLLGDHVKVNAFKALDDNGVPIDQNWTVTIVGTDGSRKVIGPSS